MTTASVSSGARDGATDIGTFQADSATRGDASRRDGSLFDIDANPETTDSSIAIACPGCVIQWTRIGAYDTEVFGHVAYVVERDDGRYLYVIGGAHGDLRPATFNRRISAARMGESGMLEAWTHTPLPTDLGIIGAAGLDDVPHDVDGRPTLMLVGGLADQPTRVGPINIVIRLDLAAGSGAGLQAIDPDALVAFGQRFSQSTFWAGGAIASEDRSDILVVTSIGGQTQRGVATSAVSSVALGAASSESGMPLPSPRRELAVASANARNYDVFVVGGTRTGSPSTEPCSAEVLLGRVRNGRIASWEVAGTGPAVCGGSAIRSVGYLYVFGGSSTLGESSAIFRAPILANEHLGDFRHVGEMPVAVRYAAVRRTSERSFVFCGGKLAQGDANRQCYSGNLIDVGDDVIVHDASPDSSDLLDAGSPREPLDAQRSD